MKKLISSHKALFVNLLAEAFWLIARLHFAQAEDAAEMVYRPSGIFVCTQLNGRPIKVPTLTLR